MIRKAVLQIGACAVLAFIAWNAFLAVNHLKQVQKTAALSLESSVIQANISGFLKDLTDMETGQRGYLLTADPQYLEPYNEGKSRIETDLARLHTALMNRPDKERPDKDRPVKERSLASQLQSLSNLKQAEMERSINLRQRGFRLRAFRLVDTNEGMKYMDEVRGILSSLSLAETSRFESQEKENATILKKALAKTITTNLWLLALTGCLFAFVRYHGRSLEEEATKSRQGLAVRDLQLQKLTFALSNQARSNTSAIESNASLLLQNYGGFLPRQGHEYAEQIKEASIQMERLRQDLVACNGANGEVKAA
jgi:CHASE3 domain sensor protein